MSKSIDKLIDGSNQSVTKKANRCRSFYFRYLELCRSKNVTPINDIKTKANSSFLELSAEKVSVNDWMLIVEALHYDQILQTLVIKTRKSGGVVLDSLDTERKAKVFKQKAPIYTKFVFSGIMEAVSHCVSANKNLKVLHLEGLPLCDIYVDTIAKAMATSDALRDVSFARSNIQDDGCETICNTIKYLENVEKVNLSDCHLTTKGAEFVADMIKMQKISRFTEGWQKSLRYRDVDPNSIPGLREIYLSRNPGIEDNGVKAICEVLKEDVWIKVIEMENCGISDLGANCVIDCLAYNNFITEFNVNNNSDISKFLLRSIHDQLGKEDEEQRALDEHQQYMNGVTNGIMGNKKVSMSQIRDRLKFLEDQLEFERVLRKKAEQLNERLNQQILAYENQIEETINSKIPSGFVVVRNDALQEIIRERNELQDLVHNSQIEVAENQHMNTYRSGNPSDDSIAQTLRTLPFVKFYETSPEESADENIPRKMTNTARIRRIKSEMVQVEVLSPTHPKDKIEARSDNEFLNEPQSPSPPVISAYETFVGDYMENSTYQSTYRKSGKSKGEKKPSLLPVDEYTEDEYEKCGISEPNKANATDNKLNADNFNGVEWVNMDTSRTRTSETIESIDIQPMANPVTMMQQSMKVFLKPKSGKPKTNANQNPNHKQFQQVEIGQGDGDMNAEKDMNDIISKSPRSLFFGIGTD